MNDDDCLEFIEDVESSTQYQSISYLVQNIRRPFLDYMQGVFHTNENKPFIIPFTKDLHEFIKSKFSEMNINPQYFLEFMNQNDSCGWVRYFTYVYLCPLDLSEQQKESHQCDADLFISVVMGFIFDFNRKKLLYLSEITKGEVFHYETNDYKLTKAGGVEFNADYFVFDNKAYLYSLYTVTKPITFGDCMPGFARVISDEVTTGDILLRLDERLALPREQAISYSTLDFEKFYGPSFNFKGNTLTDRKTITVHYHPDTMNKLLFIVKKCEDDSNGAFWHIEIETLPNMDKAVTGRVCTTFLHGMYWPDREVFTHIDFARNEYDISDYKKKYVGSEEHVDYYADKECHYKIWCIENGQYTREVWYKLIKVSLGEEYQELFDEILEMNESRKEKCA